ncbi:MAG: hypothetical protein K2L12_06250, partial [Clostridia bacterium]|nr:hypothetical protein [Clostridia bacterium]
YFKRQKVIGDFVCDRIDKMIPDYNPITKRFFYNNDWQISDWNSNDTCLSTAEINAYGKEKQLYGWHISDLKIYDKPKELGEFYPYKEVVAGTCKNKDCNKTGLGCYKCLGVKPITCPPQSWCYVEGFK